MRGYIEQFYSEGFATTFYLRPLNYMKKKIGNKKLFKFLSIILKIVYTIGIIIFGLFMFQRKYPL